MNEVGHALTDTYEEFIEGKFDYLFKNADADLENYDVQEFRNRMLPQYESAALKALFDEEVLSNLYLDCDSLLEELSESEDILGLIVGLTSDKKPVFIHKSYERIFNSVVVVPKLPEPQRLDFTSVPKGLQQYETNV
jgi:hypothetical protein